MRVIALIEEEDVIHKILNHLDLPTEVPKPLPARSPPGQQELDFSAGQDPGQDAEHHAFSDPIYPDEVFEYDS